MAERYEGLLTGDACFAGDLDVPGVLTMVLVRSTAANADVIDIDTHAAAGLPGVTGVFTASDLGLGTMHEIFSIPQQFAQPPLAGSRVRFVGERVVAVTAESLATALDAAELVDVALVPLPAVVDPRRALDAGAPLVFTEHGTNLVLEWDLDASEGGWDE
ncbi:MAG: xanthine dehydrogenase family protein molybdopterin-binding subunit, partial [Acidimicrobiales bacterium]